MRAPAQNGPHNTTHFVWGAIEHSEDDSSGPLPNVGQERGEGNVLSKTGESVAFLDDHTPSGQDGEDSSESDAALAAESLQEASPPTLDDRIRDHALGVCSPCRFSSRPAGCRHGSTCSFCHFEHPVAPRLRKKKRNQCKQVVSCLDVLDGEERACLEAVMESNSSTSAYLRALVRNKMKNEQGEGNESNAAASVVEGSGDEQCLITTL